MTSHGDDYDPDEDLSEEQLNRLFDEGEAVEVHFGSAGGAMFYLGGRFFDVADSNGSGGITIEIVGTPVGGVQAHVGTEDSHQVPA